MRTALKIGCCGGMAVLRAADSTDVMSFADPHRNEICASVACHCLLRIIGAKALHVAASPALGSGRMILNGFDSRAAFVQIESLESLYGGLKIVL